MQLVFVILQAILLLIILVQDTVNLAPFNNLGAQVRHLGWTKLVLGTLFTASGAVVSLYLTIRFDGVLLPLSAKLFFVLWYGMRWLECSRHGINPTYLAPPRRNSTSIMPFSRALIASYRCATVSPALTPFTSSSTLWEFHVRCLVF